MCYPPLINAFLPDQHVTHILFPASHLLAPCPTYLVNPAFIHLYIQIVHSLLTMATNKVQGRIPGPLETCSEKAETYYRYTLRQLDYDKGQKLQTKVSLVTYIRFHVCRPGAKYQKYGSTWAYRLGPSEGHGPKVLFIHGINTSCHSLADIATSLSKNGCQVLLYVSYLSTSASSAYR